MSDSPLERAHLVGLMPQQPQAQYSLDEQLLTLHALANRAGLYDAADVVMTQLRIERRANELHERFPNGPERV